MVFGTSVGPRTHLQMRSDMNNALSVKNIGKSYLLAHRGTKVSKYAKLSDLLVDSAKSMFRSREQGASAPTTETFWALDDVSFDVQQGERIGIIGRNGAGKSTLLKIISRITSPTRGSIHIAGRVSSLLEVGTGFHPELTGRENIFLNGAVLGMSHGDIRQRFDEIVQFAEVERFLDTPVKHYSSGMYMRLAFSVAAHLEPDILIIDEVLAVGDAAFQKKCLGKMKDVEGSGRTVLFVSHNMGAISEFCSRAILLEQGRVKADGAPSEIIPLYSGVDGLVDRRGIFEFDGQSNESCHIKRVSFMSELKETSAVFEIFDLISIHIDYQVKKVLAELQMTVTLSKDGVDIFHACDNDDETDLLPTKPGNYGLIYQLPRRLLKEGVYSVRINAGLPTELLHDITRGLAFEVVNYSANLVKKSYRRDRTGIIASPGVWKKTQHGVI